uniref:Uncharacterized protein n=1 Tax=Anopheles atroparvus TaxID=41427 RepID=A0AAG5DPB8_ANOAO
DRPFDNAVKPRSHSSNQTYATACERGLHGFSCPKGHLSRLLKKTC